MKTIQEQYNLLKEGKGNKDVFIKSARNLFPEYVNQYTSYNDTVNILKSKSIISEGIGGLVTSSNKIPDWFAIFNENIDSLKEAKAEEKKPTKDVTDMETRGFDYKDPKNIDNVYGQEFLVGYYAEMKDPKNEDKSVDELKTIVAKNLAKDNQHYVKDGQFGVKGLGYEVKAPALGEPKEAKGKYKSSGMEPVKLKESVEHDLEEMIQIRPQKGGGGKRFIPSFHMLSRGAANSFPGLIKMVNSPAGTEMYISAKLPPVFAAIHRGRQDVRNLPPMLKKVQDKLSNEIINLIKNNFDNKTVVVNGEPMHKVNLPIAKVENGDYKITTPFAAGLTESNMNDLEAVKKEAQENSKEGYVQHINKTDNGYEISDWYDSDTTVCSYENGEEINNREDMFMDNEFDNDLDNYDDNMYDQSYQWDDENPDLRDLGANPSIYEEMASGVDYDATSAAEIKAKVGDLKKIAPYVLELGNKVTQDNRGKITVFDFDGKSKIFDNVDKFLEAIKYKAIKIQESKLRSVISNLIKEELDMKHIEEAGEDAKNKAMRVKIDKEINMRRKKLKALTTLTELEEDSVNPKKVKELKKEIEKLEAAKKKLSGGKKDKEMDESLFKDTKDPNAAPVVASSNASIAALKKAGRTEIPGTKDAR